MDFKKDKKLFIKLTLLSLPLMVISIEFISLGLKKFGKSILPERSYIKYSHLTSDLINGIRFKEPEFIHKGRGNHYIEKHGLAKTFYKDNSSNKNSNKGIIEFCDASSILCDHITCVFPIIVCNSFS